MKKILIFGCKRTGKGLYDFLSKDKLNDIWFYDDNNEVLDFFLKNEKSKVLFKSVLIKELSTFDLLIYTPSIKRNNWLLQAAIKNGVKVFNEFEYCFLKLKSKSILVTGTDGKTTTTMMIDAILSEANIKHYVAGNIGIPFSSCIDLLQEDAWFIGEVSSFMLEGATVIRPEIAVITNIAPDHIDWHGSFENYCEAKSNLLRYLSKNSIAITNFDDKNSDFLRISTTANLRYFSLLNRVEGAYLKDNALWSFENGVEEKILATEELLVKGIHNYANALSAIIVAKKIGIANEDISNALKNFNGVSHRQEKVLTFKGVTFINDSKSTSVHSAKAAINTFADENIVLLIGGRSKKEDYFGLFSFAKSKGIDNIIFFGESGMDLMMLAKQADIRNLIFELHLSDAVKKGYQLLKNKGGILLFSPACVSFDVYEDFEVRGNDFCRIVKDVINEE